MNRLSKNDYFMQIAKVVSLRSNCIRRNVGAIIIKDNMVISTGYNGTPRGIKNCNDGGCERCNSSNVISGIKLDECICSHAEENAIVQAAYHGICIKDSKMYVTLSPCLHCAKMIINAGIKEVIYLEDYSIEEPTIKLFKEANIIYKKYIKG